MLWFVEEVPVILAQFSSSDNVDDALERYAAGEVQDS